MKENERKTSNATVLLRAAAPHSQSFSESKHFLIIQHEEIREGESCSKPTGIEKKTQEKKHFFLPLLNVLYYSSLKAQDTKGSTEL